MVKCQGDKFGEDGVYVKWNHLSLSVYVYKVEEVDGKEEELLQSHILQLLHT